MDRPLTSPRTDPTAQTAIARADRERPVGLYVTIGERVGDQLVEAYRRLGLAYYEGK